MQKLTERALKRAAVVVTVVVGATLGLGSTALAADSAVGQPPTATTTATPTPTPTATAPTYPTTEAPVGDIGDFHQTFIENFDTPAAANGPFATTYANSWQPYADGTGGKYWSSSQVSAHDGYMDVALDGVHGAAGTFGTPEGAWTHVGGMFSIRARATGGSDNGVAVMLWPSSNDWADGEVNYPEGNFNADPGVNHHSMVAGQEGTRKSYDTGVTWKDWHTYSIQWIPGKSVTYLLDGKVVFKVTSQVPTTAHRYMFQVGNWGASGHLDIDWVSTYDYTGTPAG